ncbi:MAG: hypothetical protein U1F87_00190 [Kiritimatiellia bacterium]
MSDNQLDLAGLTLSGGTVLKYELGTPSPVADFWYDHVALSGPLTLAGSLRITAINNINTSFGTPVAGDRWLLMAYPTGSGMLTDNGLTVDTANSPRSPAAWSTRSTPPPTGRCTSPWPCRKPAPAP